MRNPVNDVDLPINGISRSARNDGHLVFRHSELSEESYDACRFCEKDSSVGDQYQMLDELDSSLRMTVLPLEQLFLIRHSERSEESKGTGSSIALHYGMLDETDQ